MKLDGGIPDQGQDWGGGKPDTRKQNVRRCFSVCASAHPPRSASSIQFRALDTNLPHPGPSSGPLPQSLPQPGFFWKEDFGVCLPTLRAAPGAKLKALISLTSLALESPLSNNPPVHYTLGSSRFLRHMNTLLLPQGLCTCFFL